MTFREQAENAIKHPPYNTIVHLVCGFIVGGGISLCKKDFNFWMFMEAWIVGLIILYVIFVLVGGRKNELG